MASLPYNVVEGGVKLHILVTPNAREDCVCGLEVVFDELRGEWCSLRVKVRAKPDKGLANKAVVQLIAEWLGVPKSHVDLSSAAKARHKTLFIIGDVNGLIEELDLKLGQLIKEMK